MVVIYGEFDFVAVTTQKDTKWSPINLEFVRDVAYSPSLGVMLFLEQTGYVKYCHLQNLYDTTTHTNDVPLNLVDYVLPPNDIFKDLPKKHHTIYLVESFGDIFMVRRNYHGNDKGLGGNTRDFNVYKLDIKTKEWKEVFDIGDVALFIGNSPGTSCRLSSFLTNKSCKPNSIYFNDETTLYLKHDNHGILDFAYGGSDMGIFSLTDRTIHSFYHGHDCNSKYSIPTWFMPKVNITSTQ